MKYILFFMMFLLFGCSNGTSTSKTSNQLPVPMISTTQIDTLQTVELDARLSYDNDGQIVSYAWEDANGISLGMESKLSWTVPSVAGDYTLTLIVTDDQGATASKTTVIHVTDQANQTPIVKIVAKTNVFTGETVTLDGSGSQDNDGSISSYEWKDENNHTLGTQAVISWMAPSTAGTYTLTLAVTDDQGDTASKTVAITVKLPRPTAAITADKTVLFAGESVMLDGTASTDTQGAITSYEWRDENSSQSLGTNTTASWMAPSETGSYVLSLTVTNDQSVSATKTIHIYVVNQSDSTFAPIKNLIASGKATYIMLGDSTRTNTYENQYVFEGVQAGLDDYNVSSINMSETGLYAKDAADENSSTRNWTDIVPRISGDGNSSIVDISLGVNDYGEIANNVIKSNIKRILSSIKGQKPQTHFILTVPNHTYYDDDWSMSDNLLQMYQELAAEFGIPYIDIPHVVMQDAAIDWYRISDGVQDETHLNRTPQQYLSDYILSQILP